MSRGKKPDYWAWKWAVFYSLPPTTPKCLPRSEYCCIDTNTLCAECQIILIRHYLYFDVPFEAPALCHIRRHSLNFREILYKRRNANDIPATRHHFLATKIFYAMPFYHFTIFLTFHLRDMRYTTWVFLSNASFSFLSRLMGYWVW